MKQGRLFALEAARAPALRGLAAAGLVVLVAPAATAAAVAVVVFGVLVVGARLERQARNTEDAAALAGLLGPQLPVLGKWSVEADFGRLVVAEMERRPEVVVECGSGATTVIAAACLRRNGIGRLFTLEHDERFLSATARRLEAAGLRDVVELIHAPLSPFGDTAWYDFSPGCIPPDVDLLVVDGPPVAIGSRGVAVDVFGPSLVPGGAVLADDGRVATIRRTAFRWAERHRDLDLFWLDTLKGTWRLVKADRAYPPTVSNRLVRPVLRRVHPYPTGFGRWPIGR